MRSVNSIMRVVNVCGGMAQAAAAAIEWFLTSAGITTAAPTYAGPDAHWVEDANGVYRDMGDAAVTNADAQTIPPLKGCTVTDGVMGAGTSMVFEPSAENLCLQNGAAGTTWVASNVTVVSNYLYAPNEDQLTPDAPANPAAVANGAGERNDISWDRTAGAFLYNIYWTDDGSTPSKTNGTKIAGAVSSYAHTGLTNGTLYKYVVTAENGAGESAVSSVVSATPGVADGDTVVWTENFANLDNWTDCDGTNGDSIVSGQCRITNAVIRRAATASPVCSIEAKVTRRGASSALRAYLVNGISGVSGAPGYFVAHEGGTLYLKKIDNAGSTVELDTWVGAFTVGQQYTIKMVIGAAGALSVTVDGVERLTATDTTYTSFTNAILYATDGANPTDFDDVIVKN